MIGLRGKQYFFELGHCAGVQDGFDWAACQRSGFKRRIENVRKKHRIPNMTAQHTLSAKIRGGLGEKRERGRSRCMPTIQTHEVTRDDTGWWQG
jgi:hypothetical protein